MDWTIIAKDLKNHNLSDSDFSHDLEGSNFNDYYKIFNPVSALNSRTKTSRNKNSRTKMTGLNVADALYGGTLSSKNYRRRIRHVMEYACDFDMAKNSNHSVSCSISARKSITCQNWDSWDSSLFLVRKFWESSKFEEKLNSRQKWI